MSQGKIRKVFGGALLLTIGIVCIGVAIFRLGIADQWGIQKYADSLKNMLKSRRVERVESVTPKAPVVKVTVKEKSPEVLEEITLSSPALGEVTSDVVSTLQPAEQAPEEKTIQLNNLVARSQEVYDDEEKNKKEGLLWVDQESSRYIATLGALHGLAVGSYLTVYRGEERLGQVAVEVPLDVISYVRLLDESMNLTSDHYYRVQIN